MNKLELGRTHTKKRKKKTVKYKEYRTVIHRRITKKKEKKVHENVVQFKLRSLEKIEKS